MPTENKRMTTDFSFRNQIQEFGQNEYPIAVRDSRHENNILILRYYDNGNVKKIAPDTERVYININPHDTENTHLAQERFNQNELIRISRKIVDNYSSDPNVPECKTYHTNLNFFDENELIEIFEGKLDEVNSVFEPKHDAILHLLTQVYLEYDKQIFFVLTDIDRFVGPFCLDENAPRKLVVKKSDLYNFGEYEITTNSFEKIEVNNIIRRIIIPEVHELSHISDFDFISDDNLIADFKSALSKKNAFNTEELEKLASLLKRTSELGSLDNYSKQIERLKKLIKDSKRVVIKDIDLSNVVSNLEESQKEIEELKNRRDELDLDVRNLKQGKSGIEEQIQIVIDQKNTIEKELDNLKETKERELSIQKSELEEVINHLEAKRNNLDKEIELEREKLKQDFEELEKNIDTKKRIDKDLERGIETLRYKFIDAQRNAQKELMNLIENKTYFDFLSGRDISSYNEIDKDYKEYKVNSSVERDSFRDNIEEQLKGKNRIFEKHFIDNLLISIHQNTLTILAGLPGTGKTSLARILLNILTPKERICEVSVSRGWTSQKDLIGFFNPLSKRFHASNTGIYDLLKQLDYEAKQDWFEDSPMSYVILDEANLSPIEHYWSCFYNLTDAAARKNRLLEVNLGGNETIQYTNNLRFVGTINYDQTTESLSPRVLDRANIIQIPNKKFSITEITDNEIKTIDISYRQLRTFYRLQDFSDERMNIVFDDDIKEIYDEVSKLFKELSISISPRLEIAIKRYCMVARQLMKEKNKPIDYCIAQRLLPKIALQGDDARKRLIKLKNYLDAEELSISSSILNRIIRYGKEGMFEDNYDYFLTLSHV